MRGTTASFSFGLLGEHFFGFFLGDFLRVLVFRDFDVIEAAGALYVGAVSANDNRDVAPVGDDAVDFLLIERLGSF